MTENNTEQLSVKCWSCGKPIVKEDNYCRFCGQGQGDHITYYYKPWVIVLLSLFALGPVGIYFVWKTPQLSLVAKWINTIWISVYTYILVKIAYDAYIAASAMLSAMP